MTAPADPTTTTTEGVPASVYDHDNPPAGDPPAGDPPAEGDPPAGDPPTGDPAVPPAAASGEGDPPAGDPPPAGSGEGENGDPATPPKAEGEGEETPPGTEEFNYEFLPEGEEYPAFTYPEGMSVDTDLEAMMKAEFKELVGGKGLSSEDAGRLVAKFANHMKSVDDAAKANEEATRDEWRDEIIADPVMGGPKFESSKELVGLGKQHLLTQGGQLAEFVKLCNETALGDHPGAFAALRYIGLHFVKEPGPPDEPTPQEETVDLKTMGGIAKALYPTKKDDGG